MEKSINRIANYLLEIAPFTIILYSRFDPENSVKVKNKIKCVYFNSHRDQISEPVNLNSTENKDEYRVDYLIFKFRILEHCKKFPNHRHVILSFYISSCGFIAQHVASDLNIPHIACIRGSDFHQDLYSPYRHAGIAFVIQNATWIITTNKLQEEKIKKEFHRYGRVTTIYNSITSKTKAKWKPTTNKTLHIVADCGYSYKKSTHLLIKSIAELSEDGFNITLSIIGNTEKTQEKFWLEFLNKYKNKYPQTFNFRNYIDSKEVEKFILQGDLYCALSLSEGCSNGTLLALLLGIPIVATRVGALEDIGKNCNNLFFVEPGSTSELKLKIKEIINKKKNKSLPLKTNSSKEIERIVSPIREKEDWENVIIDLLPKRQTISKFNQKRILFFVHDGTGLGHLKRVCRIARSLQGDFACLIVTGHRAASWIVPEECEYVHIPSLDSLFQNKSSYWGREPFLKVDKSEAVTLRKEIIKSVVSAFQPDVFISDFLPLGKYNELYEVIDSTNCIKYFILRGVLDRSDNVKLDIFRTKGEYVLENKYNRIFVAADPKVINPITEYSLGKKIADKIVFTGYVSDAVPQSLKQSVRNARGLRATDKWIICSAGGGILGERLIDECYRISRKMPNYFFEIITGPKSALNNSLGFKEVVNDGNTHFMKETANLGAIHAASDVVITHGGYNTIVETLEGCAHLICNPVQLQTSDEQYIHASKLKKYLPITINTDIYKLEEILMKKVTEPVNEYAYGRSALNFNGIETIRKIIYEDVSKY